MEISKRFMIDLGLVLAILGAAVTGGVAWGQLENRVVQVEDKQTKAENTAKALEEIKLKQAVGETKQQQLIEDNREIKQLLKDLNRKLDEQN